MGITKNDADNGFVKIIVDQQHRILGVHVVGPHAALLVQPFVYLMNVGEYPFDDVVCPKGGTYLPVLDSMVIHPALSELTAWAFERLEWYSA